jgi:nucleoside-diphosphate-sugar epimerase
MEGKLMKVFVTGHEGYIGAVMVPMLLAAGHTVTGVDSGYYATQTETTGTPAFISIRKDVRDLECQDLLGVDAVIHLAALSNDPLGNLQPEWTEQVNHLASVRLAEIAKQAGVKRFLFSSSCSVYGVAAPGALADENSPIKPLTAYAKSKVDTEHDVAQLADEDFSPVFLRNATAYGWSPRFRVDLVLNNLAGTAHTTGEILILSDGTPWRPIVHVEDISRAFLAMLEAPIDKIHNQVINVGVQDQNYQISDLAASIQKSFRGCCVTYAAGGGPDPRSYRVDFSKLHQSFPSYQPTWNAVLGGQELQQAYQTVDFKLEDMTSPRYVRLAQLQALIKGGQLDDNLRWVKGGNDVG